MSTLLIDMPKYVLKKSKKNNEGTSSQSFGF